MRIYIAGPYTHGDVAVNVRRAMYAGLSLMLKGHSPFIPHLWHFLHLQSPQEYETWMRHSFVWLQQCEAVWRIPGESPGADREVALGKELGLTIFYHETEIL